MTRRDELRLLHTMCNDLGEALPDAAFSVDEVFDSVDVFAYGRWHALIYLDALPSKNRRTRRRAGAAHSHWCESKALMRYLSDYDAFNAAVGYAMEITLP